jgi:anti-sigma B factor antagonist
MQIDHRSENGIDIVKLPERLVMANAPAARTALKQIVQQGTGRLVIDLTSTALMDSSGLSVLVSGLRAARDKGGDIHLAGMSTNLHALFELTRLHTVFQIFDDEAAALRAFT